MEVAIGNTPFQTQVHEWQQHHPSPVAEANPIENHWIKGSFNTYGKMVTNNFLTPDGTKHTQKKQMEILQARTKEGGALQVVKSTTSQSMSSRTISLSSSNTNTLGIGSMSAAERPSSLSLKTMNTSPILNSSYNSNEKWNGNRAKSQSNEDLVQQNDDSDLEMNQAWNRISRIRRSFQYPSPCSSTARTNTRPLDFPTKISVDVNKIRQELESICGANKGDKASPNDDGEFVALDSILKGANVEKSENMKKKEIVTAETLLDIRNSLRRLEDESLYKDTVLNSPRNSLLLDNDHSKINYSNASPSVRSSFGNWRSKLLNNEISPSNSLLRRKSYAFERLEQQDDKMESSTDSGLGRSSPTTDRKRNSLLAISRSKLSPTRITLFNDSHLISLPKSSKFSMPTTLSTGSRFDFEGRTSIHINGHNEDDSSSQDGILDENGKKSTKRVEFCKTEVHFTPDSGRVNIVESEAKPPPTNNFRRRRRVSSSTCSVSSANSNKSVTDSTQFCRYGEKNEVNITPELIMNDVSDYSGDSNSFNNYLDQVEDMSIRGILKNKPVKPRRYLLGENMKDTDSIWGVKLNPIYNEDENISQNDAIDAKSDKNTSKVNDFGYSTKIDFTFKDDTGTWNEDSNSEYLNSNKLSIELYSPTNSLDRNTVKSEKPKKRPVPIPRTIMSDSEGVVKPSRIIAKSKAFEQLALKSGARQLKPTELVYFGILANNNQNSSNYDQKNSTNQHRNSNPSSPLLTRISKSYVSPSNQTFQIQQKYSQDGIRSNDVSPVNDYFYNTSFERPSSQKPSSDVFEKSYNESYNSDTMSSNTSTIERINKFEKTIRENLIGNVSLEKKSYVRLSPKVKSRSEMLGLGLKESSVDFDVDQYDRSQDYKRDEKVLAELTRAADDIMNTIKKMDEEETRRKSRSHHHQQYMEVMETINEKPTQTARPSLSSASSQESISSLRKSPGRQTINRIPLRRNSIESKTETVPKQTSSKTSTSTRECRRILRTASREVVNSSSEDLAKDTIKTDPPRRVRRIKVINENQSQVDHSESKPKDKISNKKQDSKSRSNSSRNKVYTHRLKKVDDISMKPTSSSNSKRYTSKSRASSSSIRSSKTSL
uniref:CSON005454 protein n=1 Tax=Culicoides sonorensis TaxID=179676 RepID=A0A336LUW4_CULSO